MKSTALLLSLLSLGCSPHSTDSTEVGVRVAKIGLLEGKGVIADVYAPGATYFFPPVVNDWYVFDIALQNLVMTKDTHTGDRVGDDALQFKTVDGNDINVDVTVAWTIDPTRANYLVQFVGPNTAAVRERLVRPVSRTVIRDVLNELPSEEYYDAEIRFQKAEEAAAVLDHYLAPEGIIIKQVLLGEHRFNDRYEQIIRDKKVAEQDASRLISETEAARAQMLQELEVAKGDVLQTVETARGEAAKRQISADANYFQRERQAQAILAERSNHAQGIAEQAKALAGSGGRNLVKLEVAESLKGKTIIFVPTGGMDLRTTDMNQLLQTYGVVQATK